MLFIKSQGISGYLRLVSQFADSYHLDFFYNCLQGNINLRV
jgi:hypothetical protein